MEQWEAMMGGKTFITDLGEDAESTCASVTSAMNSVCVPQSTVEITLPEITAFACSERYAMPFSVRGSPPESLSAVRPL